MEKGEWHMNAKDMYDSLETERGLAQIRQEESIYREIRAAMINYEFRCNTSIEVSALHPLTLNHLKEDGFDVTVGRYNSDYPTIVISWEHINQPNT